MYIFEILIVIILYLVYYKFKDVYYWEKKKVPFKRPLPIIGNMADVLLLRKNLAFLVSDLYTRFQNERYFGMWLFNIPHLIIKSPDLIKQVLVKDFDHFNDRNVISDEKIDALSANMLFFSLNPKWKFIRIKTTPMFSSGKMKYIFPQIQSIAKDMVSFLNVKCKDVVEARKLSSKFVTELICSSAFGIDSYSFGDEKSGFAKIGEDVFGISLRNAFVSATYFCKSPIVNLFKIKFVPKSTAKFLTDSILNIIEEREARKNERKDLVDVMIKFKNEHKFKSYELAAQAAQFFLAGYETVSAAISFGLFEIASSKSIQNKLRNEIYENVGADGDVSYTNLIAMEYLDKVLLEALRKYPPFPFLTRRCVRDYKIPDSDVVIEEGTAVMISLTGLHFDPKYFPDPEVFDPERFSQENINKRSPYCFLPFGEGQRMCIGRRMALFSAKLAFLHIVKNFELEVSEKTKVPLELNPKTFTLFSDQIYLNFKPIKRSAMA